MRELDAVENFFYKSWKFVCDWTLPFILVVLVCNFVLSLCKAATQNSCKDTWQIEGAFIDAHWFCPVEK